MKVRRLVLLIIWVCFVYSSELKSQRIFGLSKNEINLNKFDRHEFKIKTNLPTKVFLRQSTGDLKIDKSSTTETYEAYFHIPISFREQVPILIEVESPHLIDYRFVHLNPPNVIIAARMKQATNTTLKWTAWVFVKENTYSDMPSFVPIPNVNELPDSVKKWLKPSDCVQVDAQIVQETAKTIRDTTSNVIALANDICHFCRGIPWEWPHIPFALDAVYALNWGSSCTGHAHAGAALFRANGIPAKILLNMPGGSNYDHHWIIEYFVPDYGWVRMETAVGQHPRQAQNEIVTLACNPEDEFPVFFPSGIEGYWHTSDPALGMFNPNWGGAHSTSGRWTIPDSTSEIEYAHSLTDSVYFYYTNYWGINLIPVQQISIQEAYSYQLLALENLKKRDLDSYIANLKKALNKYQDITVEPLKAIFFDDFEKGTNGWIHGGLKDEWELGKPTHGPSASYSGDNCWGIDLDNTYENDANNWLVSPVIDLHDFVCTYLKFWVWNWVQDENQGYVYDPLWLDISIDNGVSFFPLCSHMGGVNDDPEIPDVGGWAMLALDLSKYIGNNILLRFRFQSDNSNVQPGSFIDDVLVYGRPSNITSVNSNYAATSQKYFALSQNYPNPFNASTKLSIYISDPSEVDISIYNLHGQRVRKLVSKSMILGKNEILWNGCDDIGNIVSSGVYICTMKVENVTLTRKLMSLK